MIGNPWLLLVTVGVYLEGSTLGWRRALCLLPVSHLTFGWPGVEHGGRDRHRRLLRGTEKITVSNTNEPRSSFFLINYLHLEVWMFQSIFGRDSLLWVVSEKSVEQIKSILCEK